MTRIQSTTLRSCLKTVLPDAVIRRRADEFGVVRRKRKIEIAALVWTLVLGFQVGADRTIEGLRHGQGKARGRCVRSPSAPKNSRRP